MNKDVGDSADGGRLQRRARLRLQNPRLLGQGSSSRKMLGNSNLPGIVELKAFSELLDCEYEWEDSYSNLTYGNSWNK